MTIFDAMQKSFKAVPTLAEFLRTGKTFSFEKKEYVVNIERGSFAEDDALTKDDLLEIRGGIITGTDRIQFACVPFKDGRVALLDGDENSQSTINDLSLGNTKNPTISYECLRLLMNAESMKSVYTALSNGQITLIDFTPDEYASKKPNKLGFTKMHGGTQWHRASTVLFRYKNESWLIGQDEDTYFGVVLADHPKNINDAFVSLMPQEIRKIQGILRQGEWFFAPVNESEVPPEGAFDIHAFDLPYEPGGNIHAVDGECRIKFRAPTSGKEIGFNCMRLFVKQFYVQHSQHDEVESTSSKQWYEIFKNTALRSVSVDGVD